MRLVATVLAVRYLPTRSTECPGNDGGTKGRTEANGAGVGPEAADSAVVRGGQVDARIERLDGITTGTGEVDVGADEHASGSARLKFKSEVET